MALVPSFLLEMEKRGLEYAMDSCEAWKRQVFFGQGHSGETHQISTTGNTSAHEMGTSTTMGQSIIEIGFTADVVGVSVPHTHPFSSPFCTNFFPKIHPYSATTKTNIDHRGNQGQILGSGRVKFCRKFFRTWLPRVAQLLRFFVSSTALTSQRMALVLTNAAKTSLYFFFFGACLWL